MKLKDLADKIDKLPKKIFDKNAINLGYDLAYIKKGYEQEVYNNYIIKLASQVDTLAEAYNSLRNLIMECEIE